MKEIQRRDFLKAAGTGLAAVGAFYIGTPKGVAGPNDRIRHAIIGAGRRGEHLANYFGQFDDCEVVALADVDPERRTRLKNALPHSDKILAVEDYRRILEDPTIDTVSVSTPDHWHTLAAIESLQADKHVYVEKPCAHNIREAEVLVKASQKMPHLVLQHGTQSWGSPDIIKAVQMLRDEFVGKVRMAKAINHQLRPSIGRAPETDPPPGVNYDRWLGPAPLHRFTKNRWHYNWHWFWDYGSGDIGNDGIHQVDTARWGLGVDLPNAISATGGQLFYDDDHETPDTQVVVYEYDHCYLMYEMRLWTKYRLENQENGTVFYGDKGTLEIGSHSCHYQLIGEERKQIGAGKDLSAHIRTFLDCVKNNTPDRVACPIEEGFKSTSLCLLGNIATRVGRRLVLDSNKMVCVGDEEATAMMGRTPRSGYELPPV